MSIEQEYQKKTQREHILLRPDTYLGSVEAETAPTWLLEGSRMVLRPASTVPALYKIFDELLVNAADNKQRDPTMRHVRVVIDRDQGWVSVFNDGKGIPVVQHKVHQMYVPELIFGNLLTSSNFNDAKEKTTGGRNGFGAKLANIFSTRFIVETQDEEHGKSYRQVFSDNMLHTAPPTIKPCRTKSWTKITMYPDFAKFGLTGFTEDIVATFARRVYDIAGVCPKLTVKLNGTHLKVKNFKAYVEMYTPPEMKLAHYQDTTGRWEVLVGQSEGAFQQISFVNSIFTSKGGRHVTAIVDQLVKGMTASVKKKNKELVIKPAAIKAHLWVFVNSLIVNPAFDSQTKDTLVTKRVNFGSTCDLPEEFVHKVVKAVQDRVLRWALFKQSKELKKNDGRKRTKLTGVPKLDDANWAGGKRSQECTLILTEGDSAKALAVSGLAIVGRDRYGVFPLKGKLLNVREASTKKVLENAEITNLKKILGLVQGQEYADAASLRYGHVMFMTDQDQDGSPH